MLDSDDNFVEYGTPLEPLEEDDVPSKKPILVSDQIAVDEQGRRRFHGAFTGGFSAGYYNTVGSKEGWTPSTFKSSREGRNTAATSRVAQNVQDFMDDEDLGAFGIAPQILRTTNDFEQRESRKRTRQAPPQEGPIPGVPVLEQIIKPVTDTVGMRILQRMGWRPGKGVGPKVSKDDRKSKKKEPVLKDISSNNDAPVVVDDDEEKNDNTRVYGCFVPPELRNADNKSDSEDSFEYEEFTFAPEDLDNPLCNPKENTFGLGYSGLDRTALSFGPIDLFGSQFTGRVDNKKLNIRGEAFGIGAFEDQDEEVYSRDDLSQYDFALETPEERLAQRSKDKNAKKQKGAEKSESGLIPGFVRAKKPAPEKKYFRPPHLPKDFVPIHLIRKSRFETADTDSVPSTSATAMHKDKQKQGLDRHALTIEERQVLLGEAKERIPISKEEQEAKAKEELEANRKEQAKAKAERLRKFAEVLQAYTSNKPSEVDTMGRPAFKPFMKNPEKQDRYEKYLALVAAGFKECIGDLQPPEMTEWEREREKTEFERASALYKPIAGVMSSRFVSAKSHDISHVVPIKECVQEKDPTQDPLVAAKMNLFGKLTHRVFEWHPDRLVSKRFNVPHPHPDSKMVGVRRIPEPRAAAAQGQVSNPPTLAPPAAKKLLFDNIDFSKPPPGLLPAGTSTSYSNTSEGDLLPPGTETEEQFSAPLPGTSVNTSLSQSEEETPPPIPKPSIDLFKEIFENSSSESEEEEEAPPAVPNTKPLPNASGSGLMRRDDRPQDKPEIKVKGIFDNLNFSKLESTTPESSLRSSNQIKDTEASGSKTTFVMQRRTNEISDEEEEDIYGPTLPAQPSVKVKAAVSSSSAKPSFSSATNLSRTEDKKEDSEEEEEWVEVDRNESNSRKRSSSSSKKKESNKSHSHHHKKKKSHSHKSKSSKKSKSKKDHKNKSSKKIKKRRRETSSSSNSSDEGSSASSQDDLSPILIHQSVSHKALLSKLKEITQSR